MNATLENVGPCRKLLKVEFSAEEVGKEYAESLAAYAKHGTVKGFRPGRAPAELVRRKYGKQIEEGLKEHLLAMGFRQAIEEHKIDPIAEMGLEQSELKEGQPFAFSVTLDVEPDFALPEYKGIEVDAKKVEIAEEAVGQAVDRYLESTGKYEDVAEDRPARENDMVAVDYAATVDGKPMGEYSEKAKSLAEGKDFWVIANDEYSFLPGYGPQLAGMKVGDKKDVEVAFGDEFPIEELRGKKAVFATEAKKLRARAKPAMDEAFFKSMGVKDEAELRATFRGMLEREAETRERGRRRDQLLDALLKAAEVEVPETEVKAESNRIVYDMVDDNVRRGVSEEQIRENIGKITESAQAAAKDRVKLRHLLKRIAREEKIGATDAEVSGLMASHAMRAGHRTAKDWIRAGKLKERELRAGLKQDLLTSKTVDFLLANAKLTGEGAGAAQE